MTSEVSASIKCFDLLFKKSFTHEPTSLAKADCAHSVMSDFLQSHGL